MIELLAAIAIISILAALLLPALGLAKAKAKQIGCINHERQLTVVWALYAGDYSDALARNGIPDQYLTGAAGKPRQLWVEGVFFYAGDNTNADLLLDPRHSLFAPYLQTAKVYLCPADRDTVNVYGQSYPKLRSYSMNCYVGWNGAVDSRLATDFPRFRVFRKYSEVTAAKPSGLSVLQDVNPKSICWPFFGIYMTQDQFFNFPASQHNRGGVTSFADGHAERHRWKDARTVAAQSADYHRHREDSPNNQDLSWLRERATRPD